MAMPYHHQEENILVVTHGIVVNYLIDQYSNQPMYNRARDVPSATISIVI